MAWIPSDNSSPVIDIELYGVWGRSKPPIYFPSIVDTGFTSGVSIPIMKALPLGLVLLSTANFTLADGSIDNTYICIGMVRLGEIEKVMSFALSKGNDILLGTEFLKEFNVKLELDYKNKTFSLMPQ